jgi:hypothetical protein
MRFARAVSNPPGRFLGIGAPRRTSTTRAGEPSHLHLIEWASHPAATAVEDVVSIIVMEDSRFKRRFSRRVGGQTQCLML